VAVEGETCARCVSRPLVGALARRIVCIPMIHNVSIDVTIKMTRSYRSQTYDVPNAEMDENQVDEGVIRERQKCQLPMRIRMA
jgi:hypothetical protein